MNNNKEILQLIITGMIGLLIILSTYLIVDIKTSNISQDVIKNILAIEYDKVGGMENYVKINKIQKEQITAGLKQYENQNGKIDIKNNIAKTKINNIPKPAPAGKILSLEKIKEITSKDTYILGNPDAEITWIEYSDLECPFCKKLHNSGTIEKVMKAYNGKVNFIFKQFPLSFHKNAPKEAEGVLCAGELGGTESYYKYITTIFQRTRGNGIGFPLSGLIPLAVEQGLDETKFKECLNSGKYSNKVQTEMAEGAGLFGITGTPGNVLINNKTGKWDKLPGAYPTESFKQKIDSLLQ